MVFGPGQCKFRLIKSWKIINESSMKNKIQFWKFDLEVSDRSKVTFKLASIFLSLVSIE